jgi:prefoldin subunit 5
MFPFLGKFRAQLDNSQREIELLREEIAHLKTVNARLEMRAADIETYKTTIERLRNVILQVHELIANDLTPVYRDEK